MSKGFVGSCGYTASVGSRPNLANYHRWIFDPRQKIRPWGTSLWPPGDPSEVRSRQSESRLVYNDSRTGFYVDEQHDLRHQGRQRGHFLCSLRCEQRAKAISNQKHHGSFKHYKVSFELQQRIFMHEWYLNFTFKKITVWGLHFLWARCGPRFLYMKDLAHLTFSATRRGRSDACPDFRGAETKVPQPAKVPGGSGAQVCWSHSLCSWRLRRRQGQQWRNRDLDAHVFICSSVLPGWAAGGGRWMEHLMKSSKGFWPV